jgi:Raf kinase inhibitor-like YbhB/YbcL family protein
MSPLTLYNIDIATLTLESPAFRNNEFIPTQFTCDGSGINPPLRISDIPAETQSLALIVDDPDAPNGTFDHWLMWNISPHGRIDENAVPGVIGRNGKGDNRYTGPCPPSGIHHYHFKVYALDVMLNLSEGATKGELEKSMEGHVIGTGVLIGLYQKRG